jgi:endoglucanase
MALDLKAHLRELCETPGPSGFEQPVRDVIQRAWADLTTETYTDAMGSLIAVKPATVDNGKPHRVMITAHMDEIGLIVTKVDGAFLRVTRIGGVDQRVLPGQLVTVHGARDLPGVIGNRPPHVTPQAERNKYVQLDDLVVDVGLTTRQLTDLVSVGDVVSFASPAVLLGGNLLAAKALDNRASVAALTVCLDTLQTRSHAWDVVAVATVQEEVGLRGGFTTTYHVQPDLALVVDVTFAVGDGGKVPP